MAGAIVLWSGPGQREVSKNCVQPVYETYPLKVLKKQPPYPNRLEELSNMPNNLILINGKKFMWDGVDDPSAEKTLERMNKYKADGFEVELQRREWKNLSLYEEDC